MVSHCGFDLQFPVTNDFEHFFIAYWPFVYIFFREVSVQESLKKWRGFKSHLNHLLSKLTSPQSLWLFLMSASTPAPLEWLRVTAPHSNWANTHGNIFVHFWKTHFCCQLFRRFTQGSHLSLIIGQWFSPSLPVLNNVGCSWVSPLLCSKIFSVLWTLSLRPHPTPETPLHG